MRMMLIAGRLHQPSVMGVLAIERAKCTTGDTAGAKLAGPHATIEDIGSKDGILMPFLTGLRSLGHPPAFNTITRDTGPYLTASVEGICNVGLKIGVAVDTLHGAGIFHGDLYAHNILYNETTAKVLLSDFGAAFQMQAPAAKALFTTIEVRAYGALLDDLVVGLAPSITAALSSAEGVVLSQLSRLAGEILASTLSTRRSMATLLKQLVKICDALPAAGARKKTAGNNPV